MSASVIPAYGHVRLGQANPSVFSRFGAPRRLFTSRQGRTGGDAGPTTDEGVEASRQAGQSSGERGLRRRWSVVRIFAALDWAGPGWGQQREQSRSRQSMRKDTRRSNNTWWGIRILAT